MAEIIESGALFRCVQMLQIRTLCFANHLNPVMSKIRIISGQCQSRTIDGGLQNIAIKATARAYKLHAKLFPMSLEKVSNINAFYNASFVFACTQNFRCIADYNALSPDEWNIFTSAAPNTKISSHIICGRDRRQRKKGPDLNWFLVRSFHSHHLCGDIERSTDHSQHCEKQ